MFAKKALVLMVLPALAACTGNLLMGYEQPKSAPPPITEVLVEKPFGQAWEDLASIVSATDFLHVRGSDRDTGLFTVAFGWGDTSGRFVDCGTMKEGDERKPPYFFGTYTAVMKVNVVAQGSSHTRIKVRATYESKDWKFSTGESGAYFDFEFIAAPWLIVGSCRPTHLAERTVIDGIRGAAASQD